MGIFCSRRRRRRQGNDSGSPRPSHGDGSAGGEGEQAGGQEGLLQLDWEKNQQAALEQLRKEFSSRPEVFIISQMVMAVHFFKNFDRWVVFIYSG